MFKVEKYNNIEDITVEISNRLKERGSNLTDEKLKDIALNFVGEIIEIGEHGAIVEYYITNWDEPYIIDVIEESNMEEQKEVYVNEILPAMSNIELLEALRSSVRNNVRGSYREQIEMEEAEILKRMK